MVLYRRVTSLRRSADGLSKNLCSSRLIISLIRCDKNRKFLCATNGDDGNYVLRASTLECFRPVFVVVVEFFYMHKAR